MTISRRNLLFGVGATAAVTPLAACGAGGSSTGDGGTDPVLTLAPNGDNNSFDRGQLNIGNQTQFWQPVFDTLLRMDENGELHPNLATSWEYNEDMTEMSMTLQEGVTFTDGTPFDAEAVRANWEYLAESTGQNFYMTASVKEVQIVSDTELIAVLSAPDPVFEESLASVGGAMASPGTLGTDAAVNTPVGTGPYQLDAAQTVPGSTYTYTRIDDYFAVDRYPYSKIILKPMTDLTARLNALKSGQVNGTIGTIQTIEEAESSNLTVIENPLNWVGLLLFDRDGTMVPELGDVRVRQAINFAVDWQKILDNVDQGRGAHTTQIFNPEGDGYDPSLDSVYDFDLEKARSLMAEAGAEGGFTLSLPRATGSAFETYFAVLEQMLAEINITLDFVSIPANDVVPETISGKYPVGFMTLGSQSAWQDILKSVIPGGAWNPMHCEDPELNDLLETAQNASKDEQPAAMKAVSAWVVDQAWFAPWYRVRTPYFTDAGTTALKDLYVVVPPIANYSPAE